MTNGRGTRAPINRTIKPSMVRPTVAQNTWVSASLLIALVTLSTALPQGAQAQAEDPFAGVE
jgi:hypothetical protein